MNLIGHVTSLLTPLTSCSSYPGPGAYEIKTTLGKWMESHINNPGYFSIRRRTKFGNPYEREISNTARNEPGNLL